MAIDLVRELTELRKAILTMGAAVEQSVRRSLEALLRRDVEVAQLVRSQDKEIDRMELDIEEECLRVLALSHPVAGDLRFVLAVMRINTNLERIADMAKSIAKRVIDLDRLSPTTVPASLEQMAAETQVMLADTLRALADQDAPLARRIRANDDRVDDLMKEVFSWVQAEIPNNISHTESAIDYLSIARKLERMADVSTNIAADIIFLSEGHLVRHLDGKNLHRRTHLADEDRSGD